jgi:translation initiation factor 2 subunit 2
MTDLLTYDTLLTGVYAKLPKKKARADRFEIPIADSIVIGIRTTIKNFDAICAYLRRQPADVAKYFFKELAVPGVIEGPRLVLAGKFSNRAINERLAGFVRERVLCKECGKPDTELTQIDRNLYSLKCEACGAKATVRV